MAPGCCLKTAAPSPCSLGDLHLENLKISFLEVAVTILLQLKRGSSSHSLKVFSFKSGPFLFKKSIIIIQLV